jgi:hypothetical protein
MQNDSVFCHVGFRMLGFWKKKPLDWSNGYAKGIMEA